MATPTAHRVRELEIRYRPVRRTLPVSGRVSTPREAAQLAAALLEDSTVEKVLVLHLNTKHGLIGVHTLSIGTLDASLVHPREIFQGAILSNAAAFILAHNHPSGDASPSGEDRALVHRLRQAADVMGVAFLDALIVTETASYYSFKESGTLS